MIELGEYSVGDVLVTDRGDLLIVDARDFALNLLGSGSVSYVLVNVSDATIEGCVDSDRELSELWRYYEISEIRRLGDKVR